MPYALPTYVRRAGIDDPTLLHPWDDTRASADFSHDSHPWLVRLSRTTPRARIALGIGVTEWILGRFAALEHDPLLLRICEAAWCAAVHPAYMHEVELDRTAWLGPVRGPLWCAITWMTPMLAYRRLGDQELESGLDYLIRLALHVLPRTNEFVRWLDACTERLEHLYPIPDLDPFDDVFSERDPGGPLVPREALDPDRAFEPTQARACFRRFFDGLDRAANHLLVAPEDLARAGFQGTPYVIAP